MRVQDYDVTAERIVIYRLSIENLLVKDEYDVLINADDFAVALESDSSREK